MRAFEQDSTAVRLLQDALVITGIAAIKTDGIYGPETASAVVALENRFNMGRDDGVAGRQTLGILDILSQNGQGHGHGQLGHRLALTAVGLARAKVVEARRQLTVQPRTVLTETALRTHFRLGTTRPLVGVTRPDTPQDIRDIIARYDQILSLFASSATRFVTAVPVNGINTVAEAPLGGPITFGPAFADVNHHFEDNPDPNVTNRIGPNSQVAVIIHEALHVFDAMSSRANAHISEFSPEYERQPADLSLHNSSSFASFAAHVFGKMDPRPRYGLGGAIAQ